MPSIGSVGDSYDNALAEAVNALYKTELHRNPAALAANGGHWEGLDDLEVATCGWVSGSTRNASTASSTTSPRRRSKPPTTVPILTPERHKNTNPTSIDCFRPVEQAAQLLPERAEPPHDVRRTMSDRLYEDVVRAAKEHVTAGDVFQVVLSQRFDIDDLGVAPFDVYRVLRLVNPSPYLYFLRFPDVTVVGASPEPMVRLRDNGHLATDRRLRPRRSTAADDSRLEGELIEDPKEVAEHVMLVDLARNDVGRVVSFGTEVLDEVMVVERYSHIMHLTSQVSGRLAPGKGPIDVLRATLPAGTLSGAPKVRAMEIIDDLEPTKRGVYGGVVGYLDFSGNLDTAIAIRTMTVSPDGRASVQAGAGIVADSDPVTENAECAHKAAAMLSAVAMARAAVSNADGTDADQVPLVAR